MHVRAAARYRFRRGDGINQPVVLLNVPGYVATVAFAIF